MPDDYKKDDSKCEKGYGIKHKGKKHRGCNCNCKCKKSSSSSTDCIYLNIDKAEDYKNDAYD